LLLCIVADPFVKVTLCQGDRSIKTRKTSTKKNTIDPVFNESISFNVTPECLSTCSVIVTVWGHNSKAKDDFVGRIVLGKYATGPFEVTHWNRMVQCQRSPVAQWHTLRTREDCNAKCPISGTLS
jgi:Ca2+-dependent lipid-binding protein